MELSNDIVLRPRFKLRINHNSESLLSLFESKSKSQSDYIVSRVDDHIFIKIPKSKQHFWSPQLHLEIHKGYDKTDSCTIYGLFGPNPTVWTMFMFFHFIVAGFFIGFTIWIYVNWSLDNDFAIQLFVALLMVVIWFALYFSGRLGKKAGKEHMHQLHHFMRDTLRAIDLDSKS